MSLEKRQLDHIFQLVQALVSDGQAEFRPGHIAEALRERDEPMGTWQIRAALTALESAGLVEHDEERNYWSLSAEAKKAAAS